MNERVKELISQAQKEVWGNSPYNGSPEFEGYELDEGKLVELIVQECVNRLRTEMHRLDALPGREVSAQTMETAQVLIKNHFGVE